jgi:hypothetical protein
MAKKTSAQVVARAKTRILEDIGGDIIPRNVRSFSELHLYVDANSYLLDDQGDQDAGMPALRSAVSSLDIWLHKRSA